MILFSLAGALAADGQPALLGFSARPNEAPVVEMHGLLTQIGRPSFGYSRSAAQLRGTLVLSRRLTVDVRTDGSRVMDCTTRFIFGPCRQTDRMDGIARIGVAVLEGPRFRLLPYLGLGTAVEAGVALWWRSPDERFEFDASLGAPFRTDALIPGPPDVWEEIDNPPPNLKLRTELLRPEFGLTIHLDSDDRSHLRFGHFMVCPTVTFRHEYRSFSVEVTAGSVVWANVAAFGLGWRF